MLFVVDQVYGTLRGYKNSFEIGVELVSKAGPRIDGTGLKAAYKLYAASLVMITKDFARVLSFPPPLP
jgi:hypothetical protein